MPEYQEPASAEDWAAIVNNKDKEIVEVSEYHQSGRGLHRGRIRAVR